jgi:hypothetical protein
MIDDRIETQVELLIDTPEIGRPGRIGGTRELVIPRTAYIAAYRIESETVTSCEPCMGFESGRKRWSTSRTRPVNPKTGISEQLNLLQ